MKPCPYGPYDVRLAGWERGVQDATGEIAALLLEWLASDDPRMTVAEHEDLIKRTREVLGQ